MRLGVEGSGTGNVSIAREALLDLVVEAGLCSWCSVWRGSALGASGSEGAERLHGHGQHFSHRRHADRAR